MKKYLFASLSALILIFAPKIAHPAVYPVSPAPDLNLSATGLIRAKNSPLTAWIDSLGAHENCPATGIVDSNGLKSYGRFCFQSDTFARYSKKYGLSGDISDPDLQSQLVYLIIHEPDGWRNWYTTVTRKIGLPPI